MELTIETNRKEKQQPLEVQSLSAPHTLMM